MRRYYLFVTWEAKNEEEYRVVGSTRMHTVRKSFTPSNEEQVKRIISKQENVTNVVIKTYQYN